MRLRHVTIVAVLVGLLRGQQPPPAVSPLLRIAEAEKLCEVGDVEAAMLLAWRALDELAGMDPHPVRQSAALTAKFLLERHDPNDASRRAAFALVSRLQSGLALSYRRRQWYDTALGRVVVAERFDRAAAQKERDAIDKILLQRAPAVEPQPAPAAAPAINPLFVRSNTVQVDGSWRLVDGEQLECAAHDGGLYLSQWLTKTVHQDGEIRVDVRPVAAGQDFNMALVLGATGTADSTTVRVIHHHALATDVVEVYAMQANKYVDLARSNQKTAAVAGPFRLVVRVRGPRLEIRLGEGELLTVDTAAAVHGLLGLAVGLRDTSSCAVRFERVEIGPLPADRPSDEELRADRESGIHASVTAAIDAARADVTAKQPEPAARRLRRARNDAQSLPAGMLRDNLVRSIDAEIAKADRLHPKRMQTAEQCAEALAKVADEYAAKGLPRAAQYLVDVAADFAADGMAERRRRAQQAVDAWNLAQAKVRAVDLQPPTDDGTVLREWFTKGSRLGTSVARWVIEGPEARIDALQAGEISTWLPKYGLPPLDKAAVHVRLPVPGAAGGFAIDAVSSYDYAIARLIRMPGKLGLGVYRWRGNKWMRLAYGEKELDAWRLDAWFEVAIALDAARLVVKAAGMEIGVDRKLFGANPRYGLLASSEAKAQCTLALRAFRFTP